MARGGVALLLLALALGAYAGTRDTEFCYGDNEETLGVFDSDLNMCLCDVGVGSSTVVGEHCDIVPTCANPGLVDPLFVYSAIESYSAGLSGSDLHVEMTLEVAPNRRLKSLTVGTNANCGYPHDNYVYTTTPGSCSDTVSAAVSVFGLEQCGFVKANNGSHDSYSGYVSVQISERIETERGLTIERLVNAHSEVVVTLPVVLDASTLSLVVASEASIEAVVAEFDYISVPGFLRVRLSTNVQEPYKLTFTDLVVPGDLGYSVSAADDCTSGPCEQDFTFLVDLEGGEQCDVDGTWTFEFQPSCLAGYDCTGTLAAAIITADISIGSICRSVTVVNGVSAALSFEDTELAGASSPTVVPNQWFSLITEVTSVVEVVAVEYLRLVARIDGQTYYFVQEGLPVTGVATLGTADGNSASVAIRFSDDMADTIFGADPDASKSVTLEAQVAVTYGVGGVTRRSEIHSTKLKATRKLTITIETDDEGDDYSAASTTTAVFSASLLAAAAATAARV